MKTFVSLIASWSLLFSCLVFADTGSGNVSNITQPSGINQIGTNASGGAGISNISVPLGCDITQMVTIGGGFASGTTSNYYPMYVDDSAIYQVPNLKTFYITKINMFNSSANTPVLIGSSTSAAIANPTPTQPTGWHNLAMGANLAGSGIIGNAWTYGPNGTNTYSTASFGGLQFKQNTYPGFFVGTGQSYFVIIEGCVR